VLGDGLNRSPEFPLRTVSSCPGRNRRSGTWFDTRLCPGDAPRDGTTPSNSEEAWYGPGLPEYRRSFVGRGEIRRLLARSLVAEKDGSEWGLVEE
jgi:hypothetical protein